MKPRAVVLDLDGTLLNSGKEITDRCANALIDAKAAGIKLIFATARPPRAVRFDGLDITRLGTVVFYNGALFRCGETGRQYHFPIGSEAVSRVMDSVLELDRDAFVSVEVQDSWYSHKSIDFTQVQHFIENPAVIGLDAIKRMDCTKVLLADFRYTDRLAAIHGHELNILVTDNGSLVQIMSPGSSKEKAVRILCANMGIPMEHVMCFGDDYNDMGLFRDCGYCVAMENAIPELKKQADEMTASNDEDGAAVVLERVTASLTRPAAPFYSDGK